MSMKIKTLFLLLLIITIPSLVYSGLPPTRISDEGTVEGVAFTFDCVGTGIACTKSGTTATITVNSAGSVGDITDVYDCATGDCASISLSDTDLLDMSSVSVSSTTEGLILPQHATDCSTAGTAEGQVCWEADSDTLYVGDGATVAVLGGSGDNIQIDSSAVVDPDFVSTGDIDFVDTSNTVTANINAGVIIETDLDADVAPVDGDFMQYDSTGTNFTWRSGAETLSDIGAEGDLVNEAGLYSALSDVSLFLEDVVDDTTPQLAADLDAQGSNLDEIGVVNLIEQADADADVAGRGQIWVNTATPNELYFTDDAGTDFQLGAGGSGGAFDDSSDPIVQNTTSKDVHMGDGAGTLTGKVEIGGDADQPQLVIEGFSTQTDDILIIQNDADTEVATIGNNGYISGERFEFIGDTNTYISSGGLDNISIYAGNAEFMNFNETTQDIFTFNRLNGDIDFLINTDSGAAAISIDANGETMSFGVPVTLTAELTADELGIELQETDTLTDCSTFSATGGGIFYDDSEGILKKCQDNVLTDLDTSGAGAETNSLETITTGIADTEILVGNGANSAVYAVMSGDSTISNTGVVTVVDDSHNHVIANIDSMTSSALAGQVSDETGTGALVFGTSPSITSPTIVTGITLPANALDDDDISNSADVMSGQFGITIDGGGSAITTGVKGYIEVPFAMTIDQATVLCDQSGSIVIDVWKDTYANYPPVDADSITASAPPTVTTATKSQDTTLTGWTTSVTAEDIIGFNVDSITTVERCHLIISGDKT